jgi:hypothetical protein
MNTTHAKSGFSSATLEDETVELDMDAGAQKRLHTRLESV